jgi:hypothetical protein
MPRVAWWLLWSFIAACSAPLPSTRPLGEGPLAEDGGMRVAAAPVSDAKAADAAAAEKPPAQAPPDAAADYESAAEAGAGAESADAAVDAGAAPNVAGEYVGYDISTFRLQGLPESRERDDNSRALVEEAGDGLTFIFPDSSTGEEICRLSTTKPAAGVSKFRPGDTCTSESGGMKMRVVEGKAQFDGERLVIDLKLEVEASAGSESVSGELVYHFEGQRK